MSAASVCRMLMHGMSRWSRTDPCGSRLPGCCRRLRRRRPLQLRPCASDRRSSCRGRQRRSCRRRRRHSPSGGCCRRHPRRCSRSRHTHIRCRCRRQRYRALQSLVRIAAVRGIGVEDLRAVAIGEGVAGRAGIIHGGHAEGVLVGAGGAAVAKFTSSRYRAPVPLTEFSGQLEELPAEMETTVSVSASLSRML